MMKFRSRMIITFCPESNYQPAFKPHSLASLAVASMMYHEVTVSSIKDKFFGVC